MAAPEFGSESKAYPYTSFDDFEDIKAEELYKYMWGLCLTSVTSSDNISLPGAQAGGSIITQSVLQDDTKCKYKRMVMLHRCLNLSPLFLQWTLPSLNLDMSIFAKLCT